MLPLRLAQGRQLEELARDPILTVACVLLIVVCIAWVVVSRLILQNWRKAARLRGSRLDEDKDLWSEPPP